MTILKDLTTEQIFKVIAIKLKIAKLESDVQKRVAKLQSKIDSIAGGIGNGVASPFIKRKKRRMSKAGRAAIAAAARARWAAHRGKWATGSKEPAAGKKRRKMSLAARAKIAAAARARWAKAKQAGKRTL